MEYNDILNRNFAKIQKMPVFLKNWLRDYSISRLAKFVYFGDTHFKITSHGVVITLPNKIRVQNQIGQIHTAASTLLPKTATGMAVSMNILNNKLPITKNLSIRFV